LTGCGIDQDLRGPETLIDPKFKERFAARIYQFVSLNKIKR